MGVISSDIIAKAKHGAVGGKHANKKTTQKDRWDSLHPREPERVYLEKIKLLKEMEETKEESRS